MLWQQENWDAAEQWAESKLLQAKRAGEIASWGCHK